MASIKTLKDNVNETIYPQTLTNAVFNLDNQSLDNLLALKLDANKAYTKEEINSIVSTLSSLKFEVLEENEDLPAIGSTDTIYLKPKIDGEAYSYYDEYIYLENGTYEKIGDTKIDLSNYYNKQEADATFASKNLYGDTAITVGKKEGSETGEYSTALGVNAAARGQGAIAGPYCTSSGTYSVALGVDSLSSGYGSIAAGHGLTASANGQAVLGSYNNTDSESVLIVGKGADGNNRSNALTVNKNGNTWIEGNIKCGGTNYNDAPSSVVISGSVINVWTGTQAEYDNITTKDAATLYMITG